MINALIGYTGFVGGNIRRKSGDTFTDVYNSSNIADIRGKEYDLVVSAGMPAEVWKANQEPEQDWARIQGLLDNLAQVKAKQFVLISTVDVYKQPVGVDENTPIEPETTLPYGKHRFYAEQAIRKQFINHLVIRLPGLFGVGIKKNFIFDLLKGNDPSQFTHQDSIFQFYDLSRAWDDIQTGLCENLRLVNFATEPISAKEIASEVFGLDFHSTTDKLSRVYDMRTVHAEKFGGHGKYFYSKAETVKRVKQFVSEYTVSA